jgi:hypothetical protein
VYSGEYFYNFESSSFTPDGARNCWVVKGGIRQAEIAPKDGSSPWGSAHVIVRGILSAPGHYGNLGACTRVLVVVEVLKITDMKTRDGAR